MKAQTYSATKVKRHLEQYKIATMEDLKKVLGTDVRMTVFRKLRELSFRTSYSHRGKYYALQKTIHFDDIGHIIQYPSGITLLCQTMQTY